MPMDLLCACRITHQLESKFYRNAIRTGIVQFKIGSDKVTCHKMSGQRRMLGWMISKEKQKKIKKNKKRDTMVEIKDNAT